MERSLFHERINELNRSLNKSASAMASDAGMSASAMNYYLNGKRRPDSETIYKICSKFDCSADWLLGLSDVRSTSEDVKTAVTNLGVDEKFINEILELDRNTRKTLFHFLTIPGLIDAIIPYLTKIEGIHDAMEKTAFSKDIDIDEVINRDKALNGSLGVFMLTKTEATKYYAYQVGSIISSILKKETDRILAEIAGF